jgi:hypothetical protein
MNSNIQIYSPDKFGFYQVGEYKTYSKIEAIEHSLKSKINVHWNFNDEVFSKVDFSKAPDISLSELYKLRCQQIRNSYDYVVLFYSGGSDSHNVLMHWIESGCKLDEVAILISYDGSKDKYDYANAEQFCVSIPNTIELSKKHNFDYRIIDFSKYVMDYLSTGEIIYDMNHHLSPNNIAKSLLRSKIDAWKDLILSGKKVCFVWGHDKISLFPEKNGKITLQFMDQLDNLVSPITQRNYNNGWYDEFFYLSPDFPEIMKKQINIIKKFLDITTESIFNLLSYYQQEYNGRGYSRRLNMYLSDDGYRKLLYPYWDSNTFSSGKSLSTSKSRIDNWIWNGNMPQKDIFLSQHEIFQSKFASLHVDISRKKYEII